MFFMNFASVRGDWRSKRWFVTTSRGLRAINQLHILMRWLVVTAQTLWTNLWAWYFIGLDVLEVVYSNHYRILYHPFLINSKFLILLSARLLSRAWLLHLFPFYIYFCNYLPYVFRHIFRTVLCLFPSTVVSHIIPCTCPSLFWFLSMSGFTCFLILL